MSSRTVGAYFMTDEPIDSFKIAHSRIGNLQIMDDGKVFFGHIIVNTVSVGPVAYDPIRKGFYKLTVDRRNGDRRKP